MKEQDKTIKGIEQGRAEYAFQCATTASNTKKAKEYKAYVKKISTMIKTNGLGATYAFIFSKGSKGNTIESGNAYGLIYQQTADWLMKSNNKYLLPKLENSRDLARVIVELDSGAYRNLTVELLALFAWLRRFADGLISGEA